MRSYLFPIAMALLLGACTSISNLKNDISEKMFGRELAEPPAELVEFKPTVKTQVVWNTRLGESGLFDFKPAIEDDNVYAASASGEVVRLDAITGKQVWRVNAGTQLSAGVGLGANLVLVGTSQGYVIAFDRAGKLLWKAKVSSEVLSSPKESNGIVVVRAGDSRIFGLNAADGSRKWTLERSTPALALRSSAGIVIDQGVIYAGFAGGKLIAVRAEDGGVLWEATVAQPKGTTEIERIADITSLPVVEGPLVYAAAYQGRVVAIDRTNGRSNGTLHAFGLVDSQQHRALTLAQAIGDHPILRRQALTAIDQEYDDIGFVDRKQRLARHRRHDAAVRSRLEAAGIHHQIGFAADHTATIMAVAREAGQIGHERITALGQAIE